MGGLRRRRLRIGLGGLGLRLRSLRRGRRRRRGGMRGGLGVGVDGVFYYNDAMPCRFLWRYHYWYLICSAYTRGYLLAELEMGIGYGNIDLKIQLDCIGIFARYSTEYSSLPATLNESHSFISHCLSQFSHRFSSRFRDFWDLPSTTVLKSPTGSVIGKSTASSIWATKICQIGIQSAKLNAPAAICNLAAWAALPSAIWK